MNDIAVRVENLGKLYKIGARQERYRTLRDRKIKSMFRDRIFMDTSAWYAIIDKNDRDQRKEPGEYFSNMKIKGCTKI
jgi:hypothetical protein